MNSQKYYGPGQINSAYNYNAYRPSKLRSLNSKNPNYLGPGVEGERMKLNHHVSQEKVSNYSGNYGSPSVPHREYLAEIQEIHPSARHPQVISGLSKIGTGALKNLKEQREVAANQMRSRKEIVLNRANNNMSNISMNNENSPPKGYITHDI